MKHCLILLSLLLAAAGCTPQMRYSCEIPRALTAAESFQHQSPKRVAEKDDFSIWIFQGRYYVLAHAETARALRQGTLPQHAESRPGLGPYGETVVFEASPEEPELAARLEQEFRETPLLLKQYEREYYVWKHEGRFFVIGDPLTNDFFAKSGHLPLTKTLFEAGPNGETVIVEAKNNKPDFTARLEERFLETPRLIDQDTDYFVWRYRGRLYVIGSFRSSLAFEKKLLLPDSRAVFGAGPQGETVLFEQGSADGLLLRLQDTFRSRSLPSSS